MPGWLRAGLWGGFGGSALLLGAAVGYLVRVPPRLIAAIMAFGGGVLISTLSFDLMEAAFERGGFASTAIGFGAGAAIYSLANWALARRGAKHRKRSGDQQPSEAFEGTRSFAGLVTVAGFLAAFALTKLGGA